MCPYGRVSSSLIPGTDKEAAMLLQAAFFMQKASIPKLPESFYSK